ncbi:hypothetical protein [Paenibacillus soyae]|uniref:Uncharacterized protein n=1 Tax=Paenibacillus soyae TaxID=2969249 RepID=A0A9X2MSE5_9BACL|nr:hypothetical protein [Paenibacillus soyae]MCR2805334.1 hypothetical protein [Paenibacillus soyae]
MNKATEWAILKRQYLEEYAKYGGPSVKGYGKERPGTMVGYGRLPELSRKIDELERELKLGRYMEV